MTGPFEVQAIHDTTTNYTTGGVARELYDAVEGEDYTIDELIVPAGSVEGRIEVTVKRTEKLKDKTASLVLQIAESDEFQGVPRNVHRILISDGIAACPNWWYHTATIQWYMYLGEFREEKYRKRWNSTTVSKNSIRRFTPRWSSSSAKISTTKLM